MGVIVVFLTVVVLVLAPSNALIAAVVVGIVLLVSVVLMSLFDSVVLMPVAIRINISTK